MSVILRRPTDADRSAVAAFAAGLQIRPEHHVPFLGTEPTGIAGEMVKDVDDWTETAAVAEDADRLVGWLMGSIDHEMGRVWWFGPFVDTDEPAAWRTVADRLDAACRERLPTTVDEEEYAFDARHFVGGDWARGRGYTADPASAVLTLDHTIDPPTLSVRPVTPADVEVLAPLHEVLFSGTHTRGSALFAGADPNRPRLVAEHAGEVVGYIAVERQPDGSGYIDYLGVDPRHRRQGFGAELVRAGVAALDALGCRPFHLTVRAENVGARALYGRLGFTEERVLEPYRRGFTLP